MIARKPFGLAAFAAAMVARDAHSPPATELDVWTHVASFLRKLTCAIGSQLVIRAYETRLTRPCEPG